MKKSKTLTGLIWSSIERFSVQSVLFILQIIMARILNPDDYGVIGMLSIFLALSQAFVDSGFSNALIRKIDRTEKDFSTVFYFNILIGIVCYFVLFFLSPIIANFYKTPILESVTKVIAINIFFNSLVVVQRAKLTINIDFKTQTKASLLAVIISGIAGITAAIFNLGVWALVIQTVINTFLNSVLLCFLVKWKPTERFSVESFKNLFGFGSKLLASSILDTLYKNIYTLVIGKVFSANTLGNYTRAEQFAQFPSSNITGIINRVTFPLLSEQQNDTDRLRELYRKYISLSAFIIFPLMLGLAAVAKPFILIILGEKWEGVVYLLQILCFSLMWYPVHALNLNLLQVKGRSDLFLRLEIIKKIIGIVILVITIPLGLEVMCYGRILSSIICLVINTHYTGKIIQVGFFMQMKDLFPSLCYSVSMFILVFFIINLIPNLSLQIIIGIIIGIVYYILISFLTKSKELNTCLRIIRKNN